MISHASCTRARELAARDREDLAAPELAELDAHLAACDACRAEARRLSQAIDALAGLPREDRDRLRDEALAELGVEPYSRRSRLVQVLVGALAFVAIFLWLRFRPQPLPTPEGPRTSTR